MLPPQSPSSHLTDNSEGGEQTFHGYCCLSPRSQGPWEDAPQVRPLIPAIGWQETGARPSLHEETQPQSGSEGRELTQPGPNMANAL